LVGVDAGVTKEKSKGVGGRKRQKIRGGHLGAVKKDGGCDLLRGGWVGGTENQNRGWEAIG